jgi:hypothetical protein
VSMPSIRPQQKLMASLPSFTGMRLSKLMPAQFEGKIGRMPSSWIKIITWLLCGREMRSCFLAAITDLHIGIDF